MTQEEGNRNTKKVIWGVFLIALGGLFLLERFGTWGFAGIGDWWPLIFIVIGVTHLVERRIGAATTMILMGAWFLAVTSGWMGFGWHNSWPLLLIAVGIGMVVKALTGEDGRRWHPRKGEWP